MNKGFLGEHKLGQIARADYGLWMPLYAGAYFISLIVKSHTRRLGRPVRLSALFGFGKVEACGPFNSRFLYH